MNYIVSKCRYVVYPAEGPRPPQPEELAEKMAIARARRADLENAAELEAQKATAAARKGWFR